MDADRFDSLVRALSDAPSRRRLIHVLSGTAMAGLLGLDAAPTTAKKKGGGKKRKCKKGKCKKGGGNPDAGGNDNTTITCTSAGTACTFSVHPCCSGTFCCSPDGSPARACLPANECCEKELGETCTGDGQCCGSSGLCCKALSGKCVNTSEGGAGAKCSTDSGIDCCYGFTCKDRDAQGFGTCQR